MRTLLLTMLGMVMMYSGWSQQIAGAEYFIDQDPGVGQGTYVSASANADDITIDLNVSMVGIAKGFHTVGVRVKDDQGRYGIEQFRKFYVMSDGAFSNSPSVVGYEYFIDDDQGPGTGTYISKVGTEELQTLSIPIGSLGNGFHTIGVRAKDLFGKWSTSQYRRFYVLTAGSVSSGAQVSGFEFFVDVDPGPGNGTFISKTSADNLEETLNIPIGNLSNGFHTIGIRSKGVDGSWSINEYRKFYVLESSSLPSSANITTIEYFFDTDPGVGNGTLVTSSLDGGDITEDVMIDLTGKSIGEHTVYLRVIDANGKSSIAESATFEIRALGTDASLSDLTVDNTTITGFDAGTFTYDVTLPYGTTEISLGATLTDNNAVGVTGTGVISIEHQVSKTVDVEVTAEDGTTKQTYSVTFITEKNDDASLSDLTVDNTTITGFDPGTFTYDVTLPYGTSEINLAATATDDNVSGITGTGVISIKHQVSKTVDVEVTAEDGTTKQTYSVTFITEKNDDASLLDLTVDNTTITGFDAGTFTYDVTLPYGTTDINLGATATDNNVADITGTGVISIEHQVSKTVDVEVTAEDGTTKQTYSVTFITEKNDDASLSDLTVDNTTITGFDAGTFTYDVTLPYGTTEISLGATPTDNNAVGVTGTGVISIEHQVSKTVDIEVTAEDGTTKQTYSLTFITEKNDDASLSDLTVDNTTITGFDAGTFTYDVSLPVGTTSIQLEAESNDPNASVSGHGTIDVSSGSASVGIMVTAEDQITSLTYTVNFSVQKITWNGNSWNNQIGPVESEDAVIAGNFVGSLTCKDLIVNSGVSVIITGTLDVHGDLENLGEITVESGSSLLTYSGKSVNGEITIKRNTRYADGKYSFVGLPIQQKSDISGSSLGPIVYQYNETTPFGNDGISRWEDAAGIELMPGKGYAQANQQLIEFTGTPNSGTIVYSGSYTQDIDDSNEGWNMVANPYPAAIKTADFLTENVNNTTGSLYLWDDNGSDVGRGSNNDYITVNISGATDNNPANGNIESRYNQYIGSSQGFFVKLDESGNKQVVFNETMRDPGNNSDDHFFRRTEAVQRVRINLINGDGLFKQTLIAWNNDVNDDQLNKLYDAQIFNQNADNAIYSFKNGVPLAIQTITENKLAVGLGYNVGYQGVYTIQADISEYDKELYLIDHMTNEEVDLTIQDYQFSASQGQIVDRFELTFEQKVILNSENFAGWNVFSNGNEIRFIPEKGAEGQTFRVFSLDGRLILEKYMDHSTRVILNVPKGIYLISDGKDSNKIVIK